MVINKIRPKELIIKNDWKQISKNSKVDFDSNGNPKQQSKYTHNFLGFLVDEHNSLLVDAGCDTNSLGMNQATVSECAYIPQVVMLLKEQSVCKKYLY